MNIGGAFLATAGWFSSGEKTSGDLYIQEFCAKMWAGGCFHIVVAIVVATGVSVGAFAGGSFGGTLDGRRIFGAG